jgi:hypothetical protein
LLNDKVAGMEIFAECCAPLPGFTDGGEEHETRPTYQSHDGKGYQQLNQGEGVGMKAVSREM